MKMFYEPLNVNIDLQEGETLGMCLENSIMFRTFIENIWNLCNDVEGDIYITNRDKPIKMSKEATIIFNPYSVDVNEKKILTHIYAELESIISTEYYVKRNEINSMLLALLGNVEMKLPYQLTYSLEFDDQQIFKMYDLKVENTDTDLASRVADYIKLSRQVLGTKLFVLVNFSNYFTQEEIDGFRDIIMYEKSNALLIERRFDEAILSSGIDDTTDMNTRKYNERWLIIDKDGCIINV